MERILWFCSCGKENTSDKCIICHKARPHWPEFTTRQHAIIARLIRGLSDDRITEVANYLQQDNPAFSRERFIRSAKLILR